ncbi:DUF2634 domain-containing protein [Cohnella silvisoli]|uniref:DUF2634 domain-containing protein n=1 Tax=Cohnella silvisoli TaxID=2873699 RepID=A0ABV1L3R2_9BACL|nr:DUF2634 domain-containing protein [Cohnella silvisoli]MCD9025742.1 DUF2634 domain-containing protein [Cohnella silvisoli]
MANLFPVSEDLPQETLVEQEDVPFGRSWMFDYEAGEFVLTPTGKVAAAGTSEAWIEWCKKALQTERYRYLIYDRNHGQDFDDLIGRALPRPTIESEIERITTETLLTDPRTASVGSFSFVWEEDRCFFTCTAINVREDSGTIQGNVVISG